MRKVPEIAQNNAEDVQGIEPKYLQMIIKQVMIPGLRKLTFHNETKTTRHNKHCSFLKPFQHIICFVCEAARKAIVSGLIGTKIKVYIKAQD